MCICVRDVLIMRGGGGCGAQEIHNNYLDRQYPRFADPSLPNGRKCEKGARNFFPE